MMVEQQKPSPSQPPVSPFAPLELPAFLTQALQQNAPSKKRPEKERMFKQMTRRGARPGR